MAGVDWEKAYHDLEAHIENIMRETSELINNASPKLRLNKIFIEKENTLNVIIDATGDKMEYAIELIDRKGKIETIKTCYGNSNNINIKIFTRRYTNRYYS